MTEEFQDQESPTMFPNHQLPPQTTVNHHLTTIISEEADSKKQSNITSTSNECVSTDQLTRRSRGRPPGSKNKRKSPEVVVTRKPDPAMSPYILEVLGGSDIVTTVTRFCNHHNTGFFVLSGSGTVCNVSIRQPNTATAATFYGRFDLLSISATVLPPSSVMLKPFTNNDFAGKFVVSLAGQKGQIFGGAVVGPLIAAGTVYIIAASFNNPLYHRLPMEKDDCHVRNSGGGESARDQSQSSSGGDSTRHYAPPLTAAESLSMYNNCHLPSADVMWPRVPQQAQPHSSFY